MRRMSFAAVALVCFLAAPVASGQGRSTGTDKATSGENQTVIPHERVVFENEQVRIPKIHSGPHYISRMHNHPLQRVVVFLTEFDAKITAPDGTTREVKKHAGDAVWRPPERHEVQNLSDQPFDQLEIELKCPAAKQAVSGAK